MNNTIQEENYLEEIIDTEEDNFQIRRFSINYYTIQKSINVLIKWLERGKLKIPDFQRDFVWKKEASSKLIDSVMLNLPIPNIFVYKILENGEEKFLVIDGFQRLTSLYQFKKGYWSQSSGLRENEINDDKKSKFSVNIKNSQWYKLDYSSLEPADVDHYNEYSINLTVFEPSIKDDYNSIYEVFERINTGSEKLSDQEIRNAAYQGDFLKYINNYENDNQAFLSLTETDKTLYKRKNISEFYLRLFTYRRIYSRLNSNLLYFTDQEKVKITSSKKIMLNEFLRLSNKYPDEFSSDIEKVNKAIEVISAFNLDSFKTKKNNTFEEFSDRVHQVFSEALVNAVIENNFTVNTSEIEFNKIKFELLGSKTFYNLFVQKSTSTENILARVELVLKMINNEGITLEFDKE